MDEKQKLEFAACTYFLESYNSHHATNYQIVRHGDKPDFLVQDSRTGEKMGVEATHLFYDSKEAKMLLGRLPNQTHGTMTIGQLIEKLNANIDKKIQQAAKYEFKDKLFLLVRVASPIFDKKDFDMYEDEISVNEFNTFAEIWLLFLDPTVKTYSDLKRIQ